MTFSDLPEQITHDRIYKWVVFRLHYDPDTPKPRKVPYQPNGRKADISDKSTWSNFKSCMKAIEFGIGRLPGIAITPEFHIACIDIDHCISEDGTYSETAKKYLLHFKDKAYIERSVSKTGIHILFWYTGKKPMVHPEKNVEIYTEGRFIAITGDVIG